MKNLADYIDEIAYQHFKYAKQSISDYEEYERARFRANRLKSLALFLGQTNYSYYARLEDETNYNECE